MKYTVWQMEARYRDRNALGKVYRDGSEGALAAALIKWQEHSGQREEQVSSPWGSAFLGFSRRSWRPPYGFRPRKMGAIGDFWAERRHDLIHILKGLWKINMKRTRAHTRIPRKGVRWCSLDKRVSEGMRSCGCSEYESCTVNTVRWGIEPAVGESRVLMA